MEPMLLETYLKQLRLPTFLRHYRKVAEEAAHANLGYDRFLLALAEQEVAQREQHRQAQLIRAARFPTLKELADFDFSCLPQLHKPQVLELARGEYIPKAEPILMLGNPGLGKTHLATSLALAACRQGD
jgi:DNA replication protein DnaC